MRRRVVFAIPGDLQAATGGYAYDRRMIDELRTIGWDVDLLALPGSFPAPTVDDLDRTRAALADLGDDTLVLVDGLAFGAMPEIAGGEGDRLRLVALVHHPLALETGLEGERAEQLHASERRTLEAARRVVATSRTTAAQLAEEFGVAREIVHVAPPGTQPGPVSKGDGAPPTIVSVGSLIPRKGQDVLVAALSRLTDLDWRCRIVGSFQRDADFAASVSRAIVEAGLGDRVELVGEAADARAEVAAADIFALPTRHEGYGMVFAEAMAQGLPIVGCAVGAVPEVVPPQAGPLVPPNDPQAFADALRALLSDPMLRRSHAQAAKEAGARLPDWAASARLLSNALLEASA